jgi:hypothetical protein
MAKGTKTGGRTRGTPNRISRDLKEAILEAAETAGDGDLKAYLAWAAREVPGPFLSLLGKLVPLQVAASLSTPPTSKEQRDAAVAAFRRAHL